MARRRVATTPQALTVALRIAAFIALLGVTFLVVGGSASALDCEGCFEEWGTCKECTLPGWEHTNAEFSHCIGSSCYYVCGSDCEVCDFGFAC
jgi:hypothetical protein